MIANQFQLGDRVLGVAVLGKAVGGVDSISSRFVSAYDFADAQIVLPRSPPLLGEFLRLSAVSKAVEKVSSRRRVLPAVSHVRFQQRDRLVVKLDRFEGPFFQTEDDPEIAVRSGQ